MKILFATLAIFALLMAGIVVAGGGPRGAEAGPGITRAPSGPPNCAPGQDSGDDGDDFTGDADDPEDGYDNPDSDDPSAPSSSPFRVDSDDSQASGDDDAVGRDWDGFDHDIEVPDDCIGPTVTELPVSQTPQPSPTFDPSAVYNSDANCDGATNPIDALSVMKYMTGSSTGCTGYNNGLGLAGDADCNGAVNAPDASLILRQAAGVVVVTC